MPQSRVPQDDDLGPRPARLRTLGEARVLSPDGLREVLGPGKPLALLAYLACSPRQSATREHLVDLLWSDLEPDRGRHALRQTVWYLRQLFGAGALTGRGGELTLFAPIVVDRVEFLAAVDHGDLIRAAELYQGDFLGDFAAPGSIEFEHWADVERQRLRSVFLRTAETVARQWLDAGRPREAQQLARRARDADPECESAWRLLFEAIQQGEDRLALTIETDQFVSRMASLGRTPEPATRILLARAQRAEPGGPPSPGAPGLVAELVGREREFAAIVSGWQGARSMTRHLHVAAPAGLGKSRLLNDVASRLGSLGARVVLLRANPGQREIPFGFLAELAGRLAELPGAAAISPATAGALVALNPTLSARYDQPADPATGAEALRRRCSAIAELLQVVAEEQRLALLLDDLHWLDPASRQALAGVLPSLSAPGALMVTAARPVPGAEVGGERTERLSLAPLTPDQVLALTTSLALLPAAPWAESFPVALTRSTGGSPLLVLETLQLVMDRGWLGIAKGAWHCESPAQLTLALEGGSALRHRLEELDADSRWVLALLAHAGIPLDAETIVRTSGRPAPAVLEVLTRMEHRGFVHRAGERWQPAHDEIAADAMALTDAATSRAAHLGLGRALVDGAMIGRERLLRAGRHLEAAGARAELSGLFARYLRMVRGQGDGRRVGEVAHEFLGDAAPPAEIDTLVRGIPLWSRARYSSGRRMAGWAAAAATLAVGLALIGSWRGRPEAILVLREFNERATDIQLEIPLHRTGWDPESPLDATGLPERPIPARISGAGQFVPGPVPGEYYYDRRMEPGVQDIYRKDAKSDSTPLVSSPTDDVMPSPSPDGRWLAFVTGSLSPPGQYSYDVALLDLRTGEIAPLTDGPAADVGPTFSPDGTRVGFTREEDGVSRPCWVPARSGATVVCVDAGGFEPIQVLGWKDDQTLLIRGRAADRTSVIELSLAGGAPSVLIADITGASLSPDRRWMAVSAAWEGLRHEEWYVFPIESPGSRRRIELGGRMAAALNPTWERLRPPRGYLSGVTIESLPPSLRLDVTHQLRLRGHGPLSPNGAPIVGPVYWSSSDTTIATVDGNGILRPRQAGELLVTAQRGPLADTARVRIEAGDERAVFMEDWSTGIAPRWIPFGAPRPSIAAGPGERLGMLNGGDGSYTSGVYSRSSWDASEGLGAEVLVSAPITRDKWQAASVNLMAGLDSAALGSWDHINGTLPYRTPVAHLFSCAAQYPANDGKGRETTLTASGSNNADPIPIPARLGDGRWFRLRIQVFPDGTCGVAVEGEPRWRSRLSVQLVGPMAVVLYGNSDRSPILHGPLEVWEGVRSDVPWNLLAERPLADSGRKH